MNAHRTAALTSDTVAKLLAVSFALLVNQGIFYYIVRFSFGGSFQNPWPVLMCVVIMTALYLSLMKLNPYLLQVMALFIGLGVLYGMSALWSSSVAHEKILLGIIMPPLCIAAGFIVSRSGRLQTFFMTCAVLAFLTAAVYIIRGHSPSLFIPDRGRYSVIITYQHFSAVMALGAIWALQGVGRGFLRNATLVLVSCLFVYFILASGGRTGVLIVSLSIIVLAYRKIGNPFISFALLASAAVALLIVTLFLYVHAYEVTRNPEIPTTIRRIVHYALISHERGAGAGTRDVLYALAYKFFLSAPVAGIGWGNFKEAAAVLGVSAAYPHNLFLELLAETGLIGTVAFISLLGFVLTLFFRFSDDSEESNWVIVLFIAGFAISMVSGEFPSQRLLFFSLGAMVDHLTTSTRQNSVHEYARAFSGEVDPVHRRKCVTNQEES